MEPRATARPWGRPALVGLALVVASYLVIVFVGTGLSSERTAEGRTEGLPAAAYDEVYYHRPVIEQFAAAWPAPDLRNYASATTPGYHLVMAGLSRTLGMSAARALMALVCLLVPMLVYVALLRAAGPLNAALGAGALVVSSYVVASSVWITTDNFALLFVSTALIAMLRALDTEGRHRAVAMTIASVAVVGAVLTRQIHIWLCGPLFISTLVAGRAHRPTLLIGIVGCTVTTVVVASFMALWGGLTPPLFTAQHAGGFNFAAMPYILGLFGGVSLLYIGFITPTMADARALALGALLGVAGAAVFTTSPDFDAGRWGGVLWRLASHAPVVAGRSVVFLVLGGLGGAAAAVWLRRTWRSGGGVLMLAMLAFACAHTANSQVWQRYYEPFILVLVALLASRVRASKRWTPVGLAILVLGLGVITWVKVFAPLI
jgi:hypothetical protein